MLHEANRAQAMARALDERGVFVAGFFFPVVPKGTGPHPHPDVGRADQADVDHAIAAFTDAGQALGVI